MQSYYDDSIKLWYLIHLRRWQYDYAFLRIIKFIDNTKSAMEAHVYKSMKNNLTVTKLVGVGQNAKMRL